MNLTKSGPAAEVTNRGPTAEEIAGRKTLFQLGPFTLHGGAEAAWKIECDALTPADWETLAEMALCYLPPFEEAVGVPRGGLALARALNMLSVVQPAGPHPRLIVDDVLTTGGSMRAAMDRPDDIGLVVFTRGPLPPRVTALFSMPEAFTAALKEAIAGENERAATIAEQEVEHYEPDVSALDVRLSFTRRAKWKDGAAIAAAIRNLPPEHQDEGK